MPASGIQLDERTRAALVKLRERKKLTQQQLADKVGVSRWTIGQIENGTENPSRDLIDRIVDVLGKRIECRTVVRLLPKK